MMNLAFERPVGCPFGAASVRGLDLVGPQRHDLRTAREADDFDGVRRTPVIDRVATRVSMASRFAVGKTTAHEVREASDGSLRPMASVRTSLAYQDRDNAQ
jgi:hypothetical protein